MDQPPLHNKYIYIKVRNENWSLDVNFVVDASCVLDENCTQDGICQFDENFVQDEKLKTTFLDGNYLLDENMSIRWKLSSINIDEKILRLLCCKCPPFEI